MLVLEGLVVEIRQDKIRLGILVKRISGGGNKEYDKKDWLFGSRNLCPFPIGFTPLFESFV